MGIHCPSSGGDQSAFKQVDDVVPIGLKPSWQVMIATVPDGNDRSTGALL